MLFLKEDEICPKAEKCMFAKVGDDVCHGLKNRNSTFTCDLDFADEPVPVPMEPLQFCNV